MYWPAKKTSRKRKADSDGRRQTRSRIAIDVDVESNVSTTASAKCVTVDDKTLHPVKGRLSCRLNTAVQHFPQLPVAKRPRCQLH